jgi:hypothetical protein
MKMKVKGTAVIALHDDSRLNTKKVSRNIRIPSSFITHSKETINDTAS